MVTNENAKTCCESMRVNFKNSKCKGIYIFEKSINFRAIDEKDETFLISLLRQLNSKEKINLALSGRKGIKFCPWCGSSLE